jgi:hypothetical protein
MAIGRQAHQASTRASQACAADREDVPSPVRCAVCGRILVNAHGVALVAIVIREHWTCASHEPESAR